MNSHNPNLQDQLHQPADGRQGSNSRELWQWACEVSETLLVRVLGTSRKSETSKLEEVSLKFRELYPCDPVQGHAPAFSTNPLAPPEDLLDGNRCADDEDSCAGVGFRGFFGFEAQGSVSVLAGAFLQPKTT